jgi:DNA-directed RNA polymerase specialized sigma subunit
MNEEQFLLLEHKFIAKLAHYYSWKFNVSKDDLFQEGCLAAIIILRKYGNNQNQATVEKIVKKVVSRVMYRLIKEEIARREHEGTIYDFN